VANVTGHAILENVAIQSAGIKGGTNVQGFIYGSWGGRGQLNSAPPPK